MKLPVLPFMQGGNRRIVPAVTLVIEAFPMLHPFSVLLIHAVKLWRRSAHFYYSCPSGIFIAILGCAAAVMSLNPPKGKWKKFFAIVFCFFLMFAEIGLLRHQQATSEERFEKGEEHFGTLLFNFQQVDKDLIAYTVAQQRVEDDLKKPQPKIPNETSNLKRSALRLSADILNFLVERDAKTPPYPQNSNTWQQDSQRIVTYNTETDDLFSKMFGAKVLNVHSQFEKHGLKDPQLDRFYQYPTNTIGMRTAGERIGALALQLK